MGKASKQRKDTRIVQAKKEIRWVSDFIQHDECRNWNKGKGIIFLACGIGRGKTQFVLGTYCEFWKNIYEKDKEKKYTGKILYLCNRKALKESVLFKASEHGVTNMLNIASYQQLQWQIKNDETSIEDIEKKYDAIICDEAHYFITDSFNRFTETSLERLVQASYEIPVLFITATYDEILAYLDSYHEKRVKKIYKLKTDYRYLKNIYFYKEEDLYNLLDKLMEHKPKGRAQAEKIIYFCNSLKKQSAICKHYLPKNTLNDYKKSKVRFMVFKWSQYAKREIPLFVEKKQGEGVKLNEKSSEHYLEDDKKMLISTKCLDNGIDFKDKAIKHIISDITDMVSLVQCLGRKRADTDKNNRVIAKRCNFYFREYKAKHFSYQARATREEKEEADTFLQSKEEWYNKYGKNRAFNNKVLYTQWNQGKECIEVKLNRLYYEKLKGDSLFFDSIIGTSEKKATTTYKKEVLKRLGINDKKDKRIMKIETLLKSEVDDKEIKPKIEFMLQEYVASKEMMNKDKQDKFQDDIYAINNSFKNKTGGKLKRISDINKWLQKEGYSYTIKIKRPERKNHHQPSYWVIEEL